MNRVGTRRNPRAAAGAFVAEDFYPRTMVDLDAQLGLDQDVTLQLPPWGFMAAALYTSPAVVAQFAGVRFFNTREDGFWVQEVFPFLSTYFAIYPTEPGTFAVSSTISAAIACSADEGWAFTLEQLGIVGEIGSWSTGAWFGPNAIAYVSASQPLTSRVGGPVWVPPRSFFGFSHDVANTGVSGSFRLALGGSGIVS